MPPSLPLVSVIIPCWNQAQYLAECISCLTAQTYPHWEAIIVNDGSPDNTAEVARELGRSDSRIRYIEQSNRGLSGARNRGIDAALGDYLQFLDADDVILPRKLEVQIDVLLRSAQENLVAFCDFVYGQHDNMSQWLHTRMTAPMFHTKNQLVELLCRWELDLSIPPHAFLFPRSCFNAASHRFDERLANHEDWDCWMRLSHSGCQFVKTDGILAVYRARPGSMSRQRDTMWTGFEQAINQLAELWHNERLLLKLLKKKKRVMRISYDKDRAFRLLETLVEQRWFKRLAPWPIQCRLQSSLENIRHNPDPLRKYWDTSESIARPGDR